jgi:hypothetical protein
LSQRNPVTDSNPGVYAEVIAFWGWETGRWPCDKTLSATVNGGDKTYKLCHQDDQWASGQWRYFQFWVNGGPYTSYSGKVDVKAFLDWLVSAYGYSRDLWVTRSKLAARSTTTRAVKSRSRTSPSRSMGLPSPPNSPSSGSRYSLSQYRAVLLHMATRFANRAVVLLDAI